MRILSGTEFTTKFAGKPDTVFSSMLSYARIELKTVFGRKYSSTTRLLTHELYPPFWYSSDGHKTRQALIPSRYVKGNFLIYFSLFLRLLQGHGMNTPVRRLLAVTSWCNLFIHYPLIPQK
jgi:hypothetical protein